MSAFVVSDRTMQRVVSAMKKLEGSCEDADQLGRDLFELNRQAVAHRYPQEATRILENDTAGWTWSVTCPLGDGRGLPSDRTVCCEWLKAMECLHYQMSEGDAVPTSPLYAQLEKRINEYKSHVVHWLPEYEAAAWD